MLRGRNPLRSGADSWSAKDESGISLRDVLQQDVFDRLHAAPLRFVLVVVAEKMDTAVGEQAADLLFEGVCGGECLGLGARYGQYQIAEGPVLRRRMTLRRR